MKPSRGKDPVMLTPGTVQVSPRAWRATTSRNIHRRSFAAREAMKEISASLHKVAGVSSKYSFVYFNSTGRGAVEAAVSALAATGKRILVPVQGRWSKYLTDIVRTYDPSVQAIPFDRGLPLSLEKMESVLRRYRPQIVCFVAHETEQGLLNDVAGIADLCKRFRATVMVDVMSAMVAENMPLERSGVDVFVFNSAKGLRGVEPIGIVGIKNSLASRLPHSANRYFDLRREYEEQSTHGLPTAPLAPQAVLGLREALRELLEESVTARRRDIRKKMDSLKKWVVKNGLRPVTPFEYVGNFSLPIHLPGGLTYKRFNSALEKEGFRVAYGPDGETGKAFEVCVAGYLPERDLRRFMRVADKVLALKLKPEKPGPTTSRRRP